MIVIKTLPEKGNTKETSRSQKTVNIIIIIGIKNKRTLKTWPPSFLCYLVFGLLGQCFSKPGVQNHPKTPQSIQKPRIIQQARPGPLQLYQVFSSNGSHTRLIRIIWEALKNNNKKFPGFIHPWKFWFSSFEVGT